MAKLNISDILSGYFSTSALNAAFTAIEAAIENTLSRDGTTPNNMSGNIDMNSNRILNLPAPGDVKEPARLQDILDASGSLNSTTASLVTAAATTNNAGVTVQAQLNNLGESTGAANVGNTPAGNISATTVQAAINELDTEKQPLDATLTALAGTLTAANKIPYATALDTAGELDFKDEDDMVSNSATAVPSQQSVKAYVDSIIPVYNNTWVPTVTSTLNLDSTPTVTGVYFQVGNLVQFAGSVSVNATATGLTSFSVGLPISSTFTVSTDAFGTVTLSNGDAGYIIAGITGSTLDFHLDSTNTGSVSWKFTGIYKIK